VLSLKYKDNNLGMLNMMARHTLLAFLGIFFSCVLIASQVSVHAQQPKKSKQFRYINVYETSDEDRALAEVLLKNEIERFKKESGGADIIVNARSVTFRNSGGKRMMFAILEGSGACAFRGCASYVVIKRDEDSQWQSGVTTYASDLWIDTRPQGTLFPRVVTQATGRQPEYWIWDGKRFKGAGQR
jgi:hypothetical protein